MIIGLVVVKGFLGSDGFIYKDGNVVAIERNSLDKAETFNLKGYTKSAKQDVSISFVPKTKASTKTEKKDDSYYITQAAKKAEISTERIVNLSNILDNGKKVIWKKKRDDSLVYLLVLTLLILFLARRSRYAKLKSFKKKSQDAIFNSLPAFINKIIILWKSGATLDEALAKSMNAYSETGFFAQQLQRIYNMPEDNLIALHQFAISSGVRELKRLTNIMIENRNKGSYLLDKLEDERTNIWEKRKSKAIEDGKKAETKLVIPMTILLGALIMVTAAPAFLQM